MRVLIAGISSVVGRHLTRMLVQEQHEVVGIDRRPWTDPPPGVKVHPHDIRKRPAEDVFRKFRPHAVVHMATVTHLEVSTEERYRINLHGTRAVFERCAAYNAEKAVFVGRHTYYGAGPDSPMVHREDDPPMAQKTFPELADLVAADLYATTALWRHPQLETVILRMVYQLGPSRAATLASFLKGPRVPTILGFDPLFQFMHEVDMARAILAALQPRIRGVFNVAGPNPIPLSTLIQGTGRERLFIPEFVFNRLLGRFGLPRLPKGALDHIKFPVVVDAGSFREATGFAHSFSAKKTMDAFLLGESPDAAW
ncbi:MAG: NAD-dependent epimerase/dehydratase family protein [Myxococcota bacterium]